MAESWSWVSRIWKACGRSASLWCARRKRLHRPWKGADPHAAHVDRQHGAQARQHFLGRLVGEGHRQHTTRRDLAGLQQPGDAGGEHAGFARTCPSQYQGMLRRQCDGLVLFRVERL
jgi:hypothetical protein